MDNQTKQRILVGLSGGVDSAVVAYILREAGYEVSCGFMINYISDTDDCPTLVDMEEARKVAEHLGLPFHTFDFREEYEKRIVNYIYEGYQKGLTPNPDILCNNLVKFDCFLGEAREYGFDKIATGHYARITSSVIPVKTGIHQKISTVTRFAPVELDPRVEPEDDEVIFHLLK